MNAIPKDEAWQICGDIRRQNQGKWCTLAGLQCWGCIKFSKGKPDRMCLSSQQGCNLVNKRYTQKSDTGSLA